MKRDAPEPRYRHSVPFKLSTRKKTPKILCCHQEFPALVREQVMCIETGSVNSYSFIIMEVM